jgi:hypothetical protein
MSDLEVISISSGDTSPSPGESPVVVLSSVLDASFDYFGCNYQLILFEDTMSYAVNR